jgi:hypothetical protein
MAAFWRSKQQGRRWSGRQRRFLFWAASVGGLFHFSSRINLISSARWFGRSIFVNQPKAIFEKLK